MKKNIIEIYTSPEEKGSFSGISSFKKNNPKKFNNFDNNKLKSFEPYSLHKNIKKKFDRRQTVSNGIDDFWQVDLIDLSKLKHSNSFYTYLMTVICCFSKYAWVIPLKNKSAQSCRDAFESIFESGRHPNYIYSDWGNEFKGVCKKLFIEKKIIHIDSNSDNKASIVERFNRTLKTKMWRYLTFSKTKNYLKEMPKLVQSYNNSFHRTIGMAPAQVNKNNEKLLRKKMFPEEIFSETDLNNIKTSISLNFLVGDYVRIVNEKNIFAKGYTQNWSKEIYVIIFINPSLPPTYKIKNLETNIDYDWNYYNENLQKVSKEEFPFDSFEVIDQKSNKYLIKKLNSENQSQMWLNKKDIQKL